MRRAPHASKRNAAFTLIELLIVVSIIAILAAIALPNFLEAQMRAKSSRVVNDLRVVATAMESYAVQWNTYPPDGNGYPYTGQVALTTPVAYISSLLTDDFNQTWHRYEMGTGNTTSWSIAFPANVWAIASYGPDRDDDTLHILDFPYSSGACPYDPTNGTISNGDIYRIGGMPIPPNYLSDWNPVPWPVL